VSPSIEQLPSPPPAPLRILLVENDIDLRASLSEALSGEGYDVVAVTNGSEAVTLAAESEYDLVVTAIKLSGKDGLAAFEEVRQYRPTVAGIVITGYSTEDYALRAAKLQVEEYLRKPFELKTFLAAVDKVAQNKVRLFERSLKELGTHQSVLHLSISLLAVSGGFEREIVQKAVRRWLSDRFGDVTEVEEKTVLGCLAVREELERLGLEFPPGYTDLLPEEFRHYSRSIRADGADALALGRYLQESNV
jgi:CheY-like chemotaxis protein